MNFYTTILLTGAFLIMTFIASGAKNQDNLHFITDPTLSPDGKTVVFTYENDLWQTDINEGRAYRLTAMEGIESHPRFSPDGQWLAFSSTRNGSADVFVMPVEGGQIEQLTWHDGNDYVESWAWDSESIYFTSDGYNQFTSFRVNRNGGTPVRLFTNYFNTPHHMVEHPGSGELFFTESWESYRFPQRKRYKGAHNPDIKSYHPGTKEYREHTSWKGKDFWPSIDRQGRVYFVSDEWNDEYNLYTLKDGQKERLTGFPESIGRPQVSANGEKVVFCKGYQPYIYDVETANTTPLAVHLFKHDALSTSKDFKTGENITDFDASPDNKKLAFVSRDRKSVV